MKKNTLRTSQPKKDYGETMKKLLIAILVLSCVIIGVTIIGFFLLVGGILMGAGGDVGGIGGMIFGALFLVLIPLITTPWVVLTIIVLVIANKQTAFNPRNFRIFMGIILGFVVISVVANTISGTINTDNETVKNLLQWFNSLESLALIGSIVTSAIFIHKINTKRA